MSETVHLLWYIPQGSREDNGLLIGVYESLSAAEAAIERLRRKRGFLEYPQGFQIHPRKLGEDSWTDGFVRE